MSTKVDRRKLPATFEGLSALLPLRPVTDPVGLENAQEVVDALAVLDRRTEDQEQYLESLSILIEAYERHAVPIPAATPVARLKYLMDARGMTESDLGRLLGERSLGNAILSGRRDLSKSHVVTLAKHFAVSTDLFLSVAP